MSTLPGAAVWDLSSSFYPFSASAPMPWEGMDAGRDIGFARNPAVKYPE